MRFNQVTTRSAFTHRRPPSLNGKSGGFIQGVILFGIALLAVVIAAFSFSNKSTSTATTAEENKTAASTIILHGGKLREAADRFSIDRGGLQNMNFNTTVPNGLFNAVDNFIMPLAVQPRAYATGAVPAGVNDTQNGPFFLKRHAAGAAVSVAGFNVHLATTGGLTEGVCLRININLHGALAPVAIPVAAAGSDAAFTGGAGPITITSAATGGTFPAAIQQLEEGCVRSAATGGFFYFKVLGRA